MTMTQHLRMFCILVATLTVVNPPLAVAASLDQLTELTGKVQTVVTLKGRDNFTSEYRYDVSVRNLSPDKFKADSLIIVLDRITNLAGEDHEGLTGEPFLKRFDVVEQDGYTDEGKPYFHIPTGTAPDLMPQADSSPAVVRIRNRDYVAVFTPSFRVFGQKRLPNTKRTDSSQASSTGQPPAISRTDFDKLIQLLIKKGIMTEEEWRKAKQP